MLAPQRHLQEGRLALVLRRSGRRTVLKECFFQVPLQVLRPVYLDDTGTAYVYMLNPCGGVVGGDCCRVTVLVEAQGRVCLTTPSATRLYATQGPAAQQHVELTLQAGAVLEYVPEQIIPFARSFFRQDMRVHLGPGACVLLLEIVAPGRLAMGEVFAYHDYNSGVRVENAQGQLVLRERLRLRPGWRGLQGPGGLQGYHYLGTLYVLVEGTVLAAELSDAIHALLQTQPGLCGSASLLEYGGLAVRVLGETHSLVRRALHDVWDVLRRALLGYPAVLWRT
ncbi:MAG: urease accessory protein UreD [Candidatus Tectimicrobiota bacterium]